MQFQATTPRVHPDDPQLTAEIHAERLRLLFAPMIQITVVGSLVAVALALVVSTQMPAWRTWGWVALCLSAGAVRLWLALSYRRQVLLPTFDTATWHRWLTWVTALNGLVWGLSAVMIMPVHDLVTSAVIICTLVGAAALGCFTLQSSLQANLAMTVPLLTPAAVMLLSRLDPYGIFGGVGTAALAAFLLLEGRRAERRINELLWLRFTTDRIAIERAEALKLAQRHAAIKDQFLATMSHEMRTPLHGILGLAELIQKRLPSRVGPLAESRQHAALIHRSGEHLLTLINDVLDFSRIEAGRLQIEKTPLDLQGLLDDVLALSRVTAQRKGLVLSTQIDLPQPCWVMGDPARIRQVLFNLLGNAIKFTDSGHVTVRAWREGSSPVVTMAVQDSGIGIPKDMLDKVFDAFQQVDGSFGRRHQGTGLGLTISREIARAMGGDLMCRSEAGMGSEFWMEVPLPLCEDPPDTEPASDAMSSGMMPSTLPGTWLEGAPVPGATEERSRQLSGHVLLVEDNPVNALVAESVLHDMGLQVTLATGGQQALDLLLPGPHPFDAVLMDCQMPELDGLEATRRLRAHEQETGAPNVPVVALTANAGPEDRARCTAAGMDDHLAKPFASKELADVLKRHLVPRAVTA
jgi:two-component system, sensor histidine kinase